METCVKALPNQQMILGWKPTGSYVICSPPVENTDRDILLLVTNLKGFTYRLVKDGWDICGEEYKDALGDFTAYRKGIYNLIITESLEFYTRFSKATDLATLLNLTNKEDRVKLFKFVLEKG